MKFNKKGSKNNRSFTLQLNRGERSPARLPDPGPNTTTVSKLKVLDFGVGEMHFRHLSSAINRTPILLSHSGY